jgi:peptide/nickel transport system permease protein
MVNYIVSRLLQGAIVIFLISIVTFVIMRLIPADPVTLLLGEGEIQMTQEQMDAIKRKWGLDRPYHEQYLVWAVNLLRGDFGESLIRRGIPVRD